MGSSDEHKGDSFVILDIEKFVHHDTQLTTHVYWKDTGEADVGSRW